MKALAANSTLTTTPEPPHGSAQNRCLSPAQMHQPQGAPLQTKTLLQRPLQGLLYQQKGQ